MVEQELELKKLEILEKDDCKMNHQDEETYLANLASAEDTHPGACFPDCELEDLQSTAGIIPIPVIVNVLGAEEILSDEAK